MRAIATQDRNNENASGLPAEGERCTLRIDELGRGGAGLARLQDGTIAVVPRTLPGERVEAEVVSRRGRIARLALLRVLEPSMQRVEAPCEHFARCSGCQIQHLRYADQLAYKHNALCTRLTRALGAHAAELVEPVVPAPQALRYRNRNLLRVEDGELGFTDPLTHAIVPIERCLLATCGSDALLGALRDWLRGAGSQCSSWLCAVQVRTGSAAPMLVLVGDGDVVGPQRVCAWREGAPDLLLDPLHTLSQDRELAGASIHLNLKARRSKAALGRDWFHLAGPMRVEERVGPIALLLSPISFAQVNTAVAAQLYARVTAELGITREHDVLDLYCGSGALALHLARAARLVHGIEVQHRALEDARASAAVNGIANITWRAGRCERILKKLWAKGARFPVATLNPPRRGVHHELPASLRRVGVQRAAYVSCSPPTLVRDLRLFAAAGYHVQRVVPFDQFAQTYHLEALALLQA